MSQAASTTPEMPSRLQRLVDHLGFVVPLFPAIVLGLKASKLAEGRGVGNGDQYLVCLAVVTPVYLALRVVWKAAFRRILGASESRPTV